MMAVGALAENGGISRYSTFWKRDEEGIAKKDAPRVIKPERSESLRI